MPYVSSCVSPSNKFSETLTKRYFDFSFLVRYAFLIHWLYLFNHFPPVPLKYHYVKGLTMILRTNNILIFGWNKKEFSCYPKQILKMMTILKNHFPSDPPCPPHKVKFTCSPFRWIELGGYTILFYFRVNYTDLPWGSV